MSIKFEVFPIFPNFQSLKSFGKSWGKSCTKFAILDVKFRVTCDESDLYQNIVEFQNIMTRIVDLEVFYIKVTEFKNHGKLEPNSSFSLWPKWYWEEMWFNLELYILIPEYHEQIGA